MNNNKTFNPCDECRYSYSKQNQESSICKICEFKSVLNVLSKKVNSLHPTNADRIRSMTDEELASFLVSVETYGYHDQSVSGTLEMFEWLQSEVEE